jgi:plastocyanin
MKATVIAAILLATMPVTVSAQDTPARIEVGLSNFAFTPATLTLDRGKPYVLVLRNDAGGGHNFEAAKFFAAAVIDPADRAAIRDGKVDLKGGATAVIHLTAPATPGSYPLRCTHFLHATMGMTGTIVVR